MELKEQYTIDDLIEIVKILRAPGGCPWDRVQTHETIKKSLIEECYETIDALNNRDDHMFANELGDVLLQVVFHAELADERNAFNFDTVLNEICTKLILRHTHVFGKDNAGDADEALANWEKNKKKEKKLDTYTDVLNDVPHYLPALMRGEKVLKKAESGGYEYVGNTAKLLDNITNAPTDEIEKKYGRLLLDVVSLGRKLNIAPEIALADATDEFIHEFEKFEKTQKNEK